MSILNNFLSRINFSQWKLSWSKYMIDLGKEAKDGRCCPVCRTTIELEVARCMYCGAFLGEELGVGTLKPAKNVKEKNPEALLEQLRKVAGGKPSKPQPKDQFSAHTARLRKYEASLKKNANDPEAWLAKGLIHSKMKAYEKALRCFNNALELDENNREAWNAKAELLTALGRYKDVAHCYKKALELAIAEIGEKSKELSPDEKIIEEFLNEVVEDDIEERHLKELEGHDQRLKENPENVKALYSKALVLGKMDRCREAIIVLHEVTRLSPKYPNGWKMKGDLFKRMGENNKAEICYKNAHVLGSVKFACPHCGDFVASDSNRCCTCGARLKPKNGIEPNHPKVVRRIAPPKRQASKVVKGLIDGRIKKKVNKKRKGNKTRESSTALGQS